MERTVFRLFSCLPPTIVPTASLLLFSLALFLLPLFLPPLLISYPQGPKSVAPHCPKSSECSTLEQSPIEAN